MKQPLSILTAIFLLSIPGLGMAQLTTAETDDLLWMREEEKLARDTYLTFYDDWALNVFANISQSEQRHMDAILGQLQLFGLDDPVVDESVGAFTNGTLSDLYVELVDEGKPSLIDALNVGAFIEELDIQDLRQAIADTDQPSLVNVYSNLLAGSRNHLRAFVGQIVMRGVDYQAQVLEQEDVEAILDGYVAVDDTEFSIHAGLNDAWYNIETAGQGFFLTVYPAAEQVFLAWFTFETEGVDVSQEASLGSAGHRWLTAQGAYNGAVADLQVTMTEGGVFDAGEPAPVHRSDGSILLEFENCSSGTLSYDIPSIDRQGIIDIQRVVPDNVPHCEMMGSK